MATRKTTKSAKKALKKTTPRKSTARKTAAKKAAKKATKKAAKKVARKTTKQAAKKAPARKAAARKTTKRTAAKAPSKGAARKAATKTPRKSAAKQASRSTPAKKAAKKTSRKKAATKTSGIRAEKTPRRATRTVAKRPAGTSGVTAEELSQRRRAARSDAGTTMEPADGVTTNFATATAAKPRATDRRTSRTRKARKITPEEALENTRQLLEAKQARDREPPPWRQLDAEHGQSAHNQAIPARTAEQEAEVNARAEELHRAESRLDAIQGSVSQQGRHRQGRNDARD